MQLQKLEKYKAQFKYFDNHITSLQNYLEKNTASKYTKIMPAKVSNALSISEMDVIFLLSLAVKEHLLKKSFLVYTKNQESLLGKFENSNNIPNELVDNNTGDTIDEDNFYIDLVFEVA